MALTATGLTARARRVAGLSAIVAAIAAGGSLALGWLAFPTSATIDFWPPLLARGTGSGALIHYSMILDVFGYYLLLAPLAMFLHTRLRPLSPDLVRLATISGLAYMLVGALGAAVLSAVLPSLMTAYSAGSAGQRETLQIVFDAVTRGIYYGAWNSLEALLAAAWLIGIGWVLRRQRAALGVGAVVVGLAALLDGLGFILEAPLIALPGLGVFLAGVPIWTLAMGVTLLRAETVHA